MSRTISSHPRRSGKGSNRVTTTTDQFTTRRFSVTDSTLVITKLGGSDKQYAIAKLPLTIPLTEVRSVEKLESANGRTALLVLGILAVGVAVVFLAAPWDSSLD